MKLFPRIALSLALVAALSPVSAQEAPSGDAFYSPPDPLPAAPAGSVIWTRPTGAVVSLPSAERNYLVLYHSRGLDGRDIPVSGTLAVPRGEPPAGGWPIITWTHGTTGLVAACAPSRDTVAGSEHYALAPVRAMLDRFVQQGYAIAFTDFQGLGVSLGLHPFLQGEAEAHGALDILRAARQLDPAIGTRYLVMGHSQGGQADLFTASFGPSYLPEFQLLGNIAFAPASKLGDRVGDLMNDREPSVALVYAMYLLQSVASNHPEVQLDRILTPQALANLPKTRQECVSATLSRGYWATAIPNEQFLPGAELSAFLKLAAENDPDHLVIRAPTLIMQGGADVTVLPRTNDDLARAFCRNGSELLYKVFPSADHEAVVQQGLSDAMAWVKARFAEEPATTNCTALPSAARN